MVTTRPPKTIVKPTALGPVANTDTKLLIYGLFQRGRVLAQDGVADLIPGAAVYKYRTPFGKEYDGAGKGMKKGERLDSLVTRGPEWFEIIDCNSAANSRGS